jgi:hypothetical protein
VPAKMRRHHLPQLGDLDVEELMSCTWLDTIAA